MYSQYGYLACILVCIFRLLDNINLFFLSLIYAMLIYNTIKYYYLVIYLCLHQTIEYLRCLNKTLSEKHLA